MNKGQELHYCGLVRFSTKTGKIDTTMTGLGKGMLELWALQNTTKNKCTIVLDLEEKRPIMECIGTDDGFPEVCKEQENMAYQLPEELYDIMREEIDN